MRPSSPRRSASATTPCRSRARSKGLEAALTPLFAGKPRDVTEENLQARARGVIADGDLEQVRRDGRHHRQQVGNVGRLRHALWRHERRLQSDQGSLQDRGVPAVAAAQYVEAAMARCGPDGVDHSGEHHHQGADGGAAREPDRSGFAAALRRARRHSRDSWSSASGRSPRSSRRASTATPCCGSSACSISPNTSAARPRRA